MKKVIDIHHAGTAMRFLTAYFAIQREREVILTGSERMQQRPIKILVDALKQLGADIVYEKNEGYPPIRIKGKELTESQVSLHANVSSQYISALMLIAASLPNGLKIVLEGKVTSVPYILMTLSLLKEIGVEGEYQDQTIKIKPFINDKPKQVVVESDWSSASYFYSILALTDEGSITLNSYKEKSYQGDAVLSKIYTHFGIQTTFGNNSIILQKTNNQSKGVTEPLDLSNAPDIAQTIAVTCFGLGISCHLTGLHTLKIKETDRLQALKTEIEKLGGKVEITQDTLILKASDVINKNVSIQTYNDHRMAMAFAPLALKTDLIIKDARVVSKSFPDFWDDLAKLGFMI